MKEWGKENRKRICYAYTVCCRAKGKGRELAVLKEVGCKPVLLNGYYVLSKTIVSWSPGLTISHCGKCKDELVKSPFSRSLPSFEVSRTVPLRMVLLSLPGNPRAATLLAE